MKPETVIIRQATAADAPAIVELWKEFMDFHKACDPALFTRATDGHEKWAAFLSERMADATSLVLVAQAGGQLAGYCLCGLAKRRPIFAPLEYGTICDLAVTERDRRHGIGRRLFGEAQKWFASRGIHRIELGVAAANKASSAFWATMGFRPCMEKRFLEIRMAGDSSQASE